MAKKHKKPRRIKNLQREKVRQKQKQKPKPKYPILTSRLRKYILVISVILVASVILFSFLGMAGRAGKGIAQFFYAIFGRASFSLPFLLSLSAVIFLYSSKRRLLTPVFLGNILFIVGLAGVLGIGDIGKGASMPKSFWQSQLHGGWLGYFSAYPLHYYFGALVDFIVFFALGLIGGLIFWEFFPKKILLRKKALEKGDLKKKPFKEKAQAREQQQQSVGNITATPFRKERNKKVSLPEIKTTSLRFSKDANQKYQSPPIEFLEKDREKSLAGDIKANSLAIKQTLKNFGIDVEMREVNVGPTVTQYTFKPAEGVRLSRIVALSNNLSMALASHPIRIEAPIPGKSLVGIEVPNKVRALVRLRPLIASQQFQQSPEPLLFSLGRNVAGEPMYANLEEMPHLLVAGSTGSGKTISLNSLILSLVYRNSPRVLKLILIDPKRVEFPIYDSINHLLSPVVFTPQKAINALNWLVGEMERRFELLSSIKARDISSYNDILATNHKLKERKELEFMPYIVLIIDELADLMMSPRGREVEASIVRLAQMSRAVGIHLVLATQRPSVEVITGLIKANITSRIAFQVASQVDSRTILDMAGAEALLGKGDMLFVTAQFIKPKRIQGAYVSMPEVKKVVNFLKQENVSLEDNVLRESLKEELEKPGGSFKGGFTGEDPLYEQAKELVIESGKASASLLQRRLRVGYARAARLLDILEQKGVVGPANGAKPREVYLSKEKEGNDLESSSEDDGYQKV
ncbi:hypothetical protein J7J81_00775 [bacterium]|nr:hypothetical protein [bacterium]